MKSYSEILQEKCFPPISYFTPELSNLSHLDRLFEVCRDQLNDKRISEDTFFRADIKRSVERKFPEYMNEIPYQDKLRYFLHYWYMKQIHVRPVGFITNRQKQIIEIIEKDETLPIKVLGLELVDRFQNMREYITGKAELKYLFYDEADYIISIYQMVDVLGTNHKPISKQIISYIL